MITSNSLCVKMGTSHARSPGVAAADYVSMNLVPLASPFEKNSSFNISQ